MAEKTTSVLIAEDQDITRLGLRLTLEKIAGVEVVDEACDGEEAVAKAKELSPAVILMDIDLPIIDGITATKEIKRSLPNTAVIMFTSDASDESLFAALSAGADGYCLKTISAENLKTAISSVVQGAAWLDPGVAQRVLRANAEAQGKPKKEPSMEVTASSAAGLNDRQVDLLKMIEKGLSLDDMAKELGVAAADIEEQVRSILGNFLKNSQMLARTSAVLPDQPAPSIVFSEGNLVHPPGTILGDRYVIEEPIGSGGMSTVYKAKHRLMQRTVAIKMLHSQHLTKEVEVIRFYQEAKAASVLNHPNIITAFDFGVTPQYQPFLVLDYIDGSSLQDMLDSERMELSRIIKIFIQVSDALIHAHKKGVVHRDIKPSNIMVLKADDDSDFVKLVDFGIAKFLSDTDVHLTKTGDIFGTPLYMSPEQCRSLPLDLRSDIYSLGCVMYEMISGKVPFLGNSAFETMNAHVYSAPSHLPFLKPGYELPRTLEAIMFKMMEKEPEARPQSMSEVREVLIALR